MSPECIAVGQIVYDRTGREAKYLCASRNGRHIVRPGYEAYSPDPEVGSYVDYQGVEEWDELFLKPPVAKLNEEVAALNVQIETLRNQHLALRLEHVEMNREITARKERIKQHEQLKQLDDYLAGKITHFVVLNWNYSREQLYGVSVKPFAEMAQSKNDNGWGNRLKLLVLGGDSKGDLTWGINDYPGDHSSSGKETVIPCTSLEQAQAKAREIYEQKLAEWRKEPNAKGGWCAVALVRHAKELGLPIPEDAVADVERDILEEAEEKAVKAREAAAKAEAELQALRLGQPVPAENAPCAPKRR